MSVVVVQEWLLLKLRSDSGLLQSSSTSTLTNIHSTHHMKPAKKEAAVNGTKESRKKSQTVAKKDEKCICEICTCG